MIFNIQKEFKYAIRSSRLLIIFAGLMFFAILGPFMTRVVLPGLLQSQFPGMAEETVREMLDMTQTGSMRGYMGDVFEIGSIIIAFTLCGLMAQELRENTLVLPLCSGMRFPGIVGAKMIVFGAALVAAPLLSLLCNYVYAGVLFSFELSVSPVLWGGLLQGAFMVFLLACLIFWGSLFKKPIAAGFASLATVYALHIVGGLLDIHTYLPSGLLNEAQLLSETPSPGLWKSLCITAAAVTALLYFTMVRLKNIEYNER